MIARKGKYIHIEMASPRELFGVHGVQVGKNSSRKLEFYCLGVKHSGNFGVQGDLGIRGKAISDNNHRKRDLICNHPSYLSYG